MTIPVQQALQRFTTLKLSIYWYFIPILLATTIDTLTVGQIVSSVSVAAMLLTPVVVLILVIPYGAVFAKVAMYHNCQISTQNSLKIFILAFGLLSCAMQLGTFCGFTQGLTSFIFPSLAIAITSIFVQLTLKSTYARSFVILFIAVLLTSCLLLLSYKALLFLSRFG